MKKRIILGLALLIGLLVLAFFTIGPTLFDRMVNRVDRDGPLPISPQALALAARYPIVDLHADPLLWNRDLTASIGYGHIDLQRMEKGHVALQVFSSVTKTPRGQNYESNDAESDNITTLVIAQRQPIRTWTSLLQRSLYHAEKLERFAADSQGRLRIVRSARDIDKLMAERADGAQVIGAMLSIEGLQNLEGRLDTLDRLYDAGFRIAGLAHFFDNEVAGSVHGREKYGLTPFGRQVVAQMEARGMIVDLAHVSHAAIRDVLAMATRPVVVSHGGVKGVCDTNRNLTDAEIDAIAANGGLIGIGFWDAAVCDITPAGIVRSISYVRDRVGIEHVALGSDWDGAVATFFDASGAPAVIDALLAAGYSEAQIAQVMGGNALRLFSRTLPRL